MCYSVFILFIHILQKSVRIVAAAVLTAHKNLSFLSVKNSDSSDRRKIPMTVKNSNKEIVWLCNYETVTISVSL